jgi:hypothetical protein
VAHELGDRYDVDAAAGEFGAEGVPQDMAAHVIVQACGAGDRGDDIGQRVCCHPGAADRGEQRVHVDPWVTSELNAGAAASCVRRRLSALSSFYPYRAAHDLIGPVPT